MFQDLQARLRERWEEEEAVHNARMDHLEGREVRVSQAEDTAALEYRKLVLIFVPFVLFFAMAMCFLCDTPSVHREFQKSLAQMLQPFNTADPFMARDAHTRSPPVWMIPHAECNPTPKTFPSTQPQVSRRSIESLSRSEWTPLQWINCPVAFCGVAIACSPRLCPVRVRV